MDILANNEIVRARKLRNTNSHGHTFQRLSRKYLHIFFSDFKKSDFSSKRTTDIHRMEFHLL